MRRKEYRLPASEGKTLPSYLTVSQKSVERFLALHQAIFPPAPPDELQSVAPIQFLSGTLTSVDLSKGRWWPKAEELLLRHLNFCRLAISTHVAED